jgi:O-acetylhomoserine (thiol)-lyase
LANVGDSKSLVIHPASTTHFRMCDEALAQAGIGAGTIRLSVGLEDPDDLIDDLKRALKAAEKAAGNGASSAGTASGLATAAAGTGPSNTNGAKP